LGILIEWKHEFSNKERYTFLSIPTRWGY